MQVYSVGDRKTFNNISSWMGQISQHNDDEIPKIIIGNKCDLPQGERVVSTEEGLLLAEKYRVPFLETSAKEGTNINEIFFTLGQKMADKFKNNPSGTVEGVAQSNGATQITNQSPPPKKKECCGK